MSYIETAQKLFDFIDNSPTCYHAVKNAEEKLLQAGFEKLSEKETYCFYSFSYCAHVFFYGQYDVGVAASEVF